MTIATQTMKKTLFEMECGRTGMTQDVVCCEEHAQGMPPVGELLRAYTVDSDIECELCTTQPNRAVQS